MSIFAALLLAVASCTTVEVDPDAAPVTKAWLNSNSVVKGYSTSCALMLTAPEGTSYVAEVTEGADWCRLTGERVERVDATMDTKNALQWVYFSKNESNASAGYTAQIRYATIEVTFDNGYTFSLPFRQTVADAPQEYDKPWNELPKYREDANYIYQSHSAKLNGKEVRNYTYCLDKNSYAALWVAYPLHRMYTAGSANRNYSSFGYDPEVGTAYQANLVGRSYGGPYDRGHQLPAADRKCDQTFMNQTFYSTNMTPQYYKFNQGVWGKLEGSVRGQVCADTLYVVTGAYFGGEHSSTIASSTTDAGGLGKTVPTPTHYYKILLRTVSGNTGRSVDSFDDASKIKAIGVWLEHNATTTVLPRSAFMSVKDIEAKTGFSYFNMLDPDIAEQVKGSYDVSLWSFSNME